MSFLKKLIGWKSKNQKQSKGQKLGGGSDAVDDNDDDGSDEQLLQGEIYEYDIIFHDTIIGCQLGRGLDQGCYVVGVTKESAAALNDVRISDKILAVDGNIVAEYDIVLSTLQAIGRPVTLK